MTIDTAKERERLAALEGHTSGPWGADWASAEDRICVTDAQRWKAGKVDVARIEAGFDEPFESEQRANARLIAVAPDLKRDYLTALDVIDAQAAEIEQLLAANQYDPKAAQGMTAEVELGEGAGATIIDPRSFEDGGAEWVMRYGNPASISLVVASLLSSYDDLLSCGITMRDAERRLRLMRKARASLSEREP